LKRQEASRFDYFSNNHRYQKMIKTQAAWRLLADSIKKPIDYKGHILLLGFGGVGQTMLPVLLKDLGINPQNITILDREEKTAFRNYQNSGIQYIVREIVEENLDSTLSSILSEGDYLINLSLNIDGITIVEWCLQHEVMYIDTSIERWANQPDETIPDPAMRTLYVTHQRMRKAVSSYGKGHATCVVTHGANPGLVSHLAKEALLKLASDLNLDYSTPSNKEEWAQLAKATGTKVIQVAERDTQILKIPKRTNEFVNTWSCEGFWAEGRAPAEMGWGTHEDEIPVNGGIHKKGPCNAAWLNQPGFATYVRSWVPKGGTFNGFCVQHSESITLSEYLTTEDGSYRPTIYYAYQPCDAAIASVHETVGNKLLMHKQTRIAKNSIQSGIDELGVLLLGHEKTALWYGSQLSIEESRILVPGQNATTVQVIASLIGAILWTLQNPQMGYIEPDYIPYDFIMNYARPYLGTIAAEYSDWTPVLNRTPLYGQSFNKNNLWSFENFRVEF